MNLKNIFLYDIMNKVFNNMVEVNKKYNVIINKQKIKEELNNQIKKLNNFLNEKLEKNKKEINKELNKEIKKEINDNYFSG